MSVLSTCINAHLSGKKIVFFGAGNEGSSSFLRLQNAGSLVSYFVDNAPVKQNTRLYGIPVYHPDKLKEEKIEDVQVIITVVDYSGPTKQLLEMGFEDVYVSTFKDSNEKVSAVEVMENFADVINSLDTASVMSLLTDDYSKGIYKRIINKYKRGNPDFHDVFTPEPMYFNDIFLNEMLPDEVYVDAGVHTVHTVVDFVFYTNGKYKKIYAFEPDKVSYTLLKRDISDIRGVELYKYGLSNFDGEVLFDAKGNGASGIVNSGNAENAVKISVVSLDAFLKESPTFIKMDIEGAEYDALLGASNIIKNHKPKLAISLYHRPDDLVRIPLLIHKLVPEYKFYLRHHMTNHFETVLYAKI